MRTARYTADAAKDLKRHGNVAVRVRKAVTEMASGSGAHANNVTQLVGSTGFRLRVGDYRVLFDQTDTTIPSPRLLLAATPTTEGSAP